MDVFLSIARNVALLISLAFIYSIFIPTLLRAPRMVQSSATGILFGFFAIMTMLDPIPLPDGVFFDSCSVILMVAAIVGGLRGGGIALLIAGFYRWQLGGATMMTGFGAMITSVLIGVIYHRVTKGNVHFLWGALAMGVLLVFVNSAWAFTLFDAFMVLKRVTLPAIILYPVATYILMWLISLSYQRIELIDALWQSEQRQQAMFEQTPLAIMFIRPDGIIEDINSAMETLLALPKLSVIGRHYRQIDLGKDTQLDVEKMARLIQSSGKGELARASFELGHDGKKLIMDTTFLPLKNEQGEVSLIVVEAHNITDEVNSKQNQLALAFERERNQILQHLIADASHHLRTPLSIIGSSTYLIRRQLQSVSVVSDTMLEKIQSQFQRLDDARVDLNEIVEDLLNLMRLDNASQYNFVNEDFVQFVRAQTASYDSVAVTKDLTFEAILPDYEIPIEMVSDAMSRLVQNLVENGLRYTPAGGKVTLKLEAVDKQAVLTVSDTGIGIPEDELSRIFDRFYRASNALNQSRKGTGLGLSITKKTVELHKGEIRIQSEVGKGTTFTVTLPMAEVNALVAS